ncbi:hypothetical protein ISU02_07965 [Fusibacter sp. Q10-2]|uniref:Cytochrome b5 heme-binding domain-containing protein n=2 Tax=Fusibacter ferrireducens TaxID=2785058 RepID=A0ABR9ZRU5_9FIRM|nr:hypothetical protein [Fusibacter ferrireducens]
MLTIVSCTAETTAPKSDATENKSADQVDLAPTDSQSADTQAVEDQASDAQPADALPVFTPEELSKYNGKDGMAAYVGYEGKVYDVSKIKAWKNGIHQGKYEAGQDLTDILNNVAPHSPKNLTDNAPVVGTLEQN